MVEFRIDTTIAELNITKTHHPFKSYLLGFPCKGKNTCSPYEATLKPGDYQFELWGAGSTYHRNGGYVCGKIQIKTKTHLYFFVGGEKSQFNSALFKGSGIAGNGASDVRLYYSNNWSEFNSLKTRIIVAGAGGSNEKFKIGDKNGAGTMVGNYGYGGGLTGNIGLTGYNDRYKNYIVYSGDPGSQITGGAGGFSAYCKTNGGNGYFGNGGTPGKWCKCSESYTSIDGYAGSGGYYGSGGSGGTSAGFWTPVGTGGGSSFISGHIGCDAINKSSTQTNIIHSKQSIHYSQISFSQTIMIDGSGHEWINKTVGSTHLMPHPIQGTYSENSGHLGDGFIRITVLSHRFNTNIIKHFMQLQLTKAVILISTSNKF